MEKELCFQQMVLRLLESHTKEQVGAQKNNSKYMKDLNVSDKIINLL